MRKRWKPSPIKTYDSTRVYGALPRTYSKFFHGPPLRAIVEIEGKTNRGRWDILECGHKVRHYGNYRAKTRICNECPTYDDENQLRLF